MTKPLIRILAMAVALSTSLVAAGDAKGTLTYKGKTREFNVAFKFAFYVKGPDSMDPNTIVRRLILTTTDLTSTLQKCATMSCADGKEADTMMVDIGASPRLVYWLNLNDGLVQYSGTEPMPSLVTTTDTPTRLAGKLAFDRNSAGVKVSVDFDATLLKEFKKAP